MKLMNVPRNTWIKVDGCDELILFHHLDGMYSYCELGDGNVVHLRFDTPVEIARNDNGLR